MRRRDSPIAFWTYTALLIGAAAFFAYVAILVA